MRTPGFILISLGLLFPGTLPASGFRGGTIYESGSQRKKLLFSIHADLLAPNPGTRTFVSSYLDPQGQEVMTEKATFEDLHLQRYVISQKQLGETYELTVDHAKMRFSVTRAGQTEVKERSLPENLVVGPSLVPFIQQHWSELQGLHKVQAQLAVLDRKDTYGFEFMKVRELQFEGQAAVLIRMSASSTLIAAVVHPTYLTVVPDGSRILEVKGRMLPKRKVGSRWEDFEGEAYFVY